MTRPLPALILAVTLAVAAAIHPAAADDFADLVFDPRPGAQLPLNEAFIDEQGRAAALGDYFTGKPVVLVLDYLRCKTLCGVTLEHLTTALGALSVELGRDYQLVAISIDPRDKPADAEAAKAKYLALYGRAGGESGAHFLTGDGTGARRVAATIGFRYRFDAALDQYIHPAGFVIAAPDGRISRYMLTVGPAPAALQAALADAAAERVTDPLTRFLLLCHAEGAPLGRYDGPILVAFSLANLAAMAALIVLFGAIRRRRNG